MPVEHPARIGKRSQAGRSRLAGNTQKIWLIIFFGSLAFIGYKIFKLVREAKT